MYLWAGITYTNVWDLPLAMWERFCAVADAWAEAAKEATGK